VQCEGVLGGMDGRVPWVGPQLYSLPPPCKPDRQHGEKGHCLRMHRIIHNRTSPTRGLATRHPVTPTAG